MSDERKLVALAHNAALDPDAWAPLVEAILLTFRGEGGGLNVADLISRTSLQSLDYGISEAHRVQYYSDVIQTDPRIPMMAAMPVGTAFSDCKLLASDRPDHQPFYAWQAGFGYRHTMFLKILHDRQHLGAIAVTRRISEGAPQADEIAMAQRLVGTIAHAAKVSQHITALVSIQAGLEAAQAAGGRAFALLDSRGVIVHANPAFAAALARKDGLMLQNGRVGAHIRSMHRKLEQSIMHAAAGGAGCALAVARTGGLSPYHIVVEPLRPSAAERSGFQWGAHGGVLLFLDDPDSEFAGNRARALQQIYGLTPAEAVIAEAIASGLSPDEFAASRNISSATARTHLKRIFAKLEVNRQSALAAKILRLPSTPNQT